MCVTEILLLLLLEGQLRSLSEDKRYAYVTYGDLKSIAEYRNQTVMAVRAPPETKLQVSAENFIVEYWFKKHLHFQF